MWSSCSRPIFAEFAVHSKSLFAFLVAIRGLATNHHLDWARGDYCSGQRRGWRRFVKSVGGAWLMDAMSKREEVPVSMLRPMVRVTGAGLLFCLAACGGPPWTLKQSPSEIDLRWYADDTPSAAADALAQAHCRGCQISVA
jgi:hypothetical protein